MFLFWQLKNVLPLHPPQPHTQKAWTVLDIHKDSENDYMNLIITERGFPLNTMGAEMMASFPKLREVAK